MELLMAALFSIAIGLVLAGTGLIIYKSKEV